MAATTPTTSRATGVTTTICTPTPDPTRSADFYRRAGFTSVDDDAPGDWFTDGAVMVHVDPTRTARVAVVLHGDVAVREALAERGRVVEHEGRWLAADPSGVFLWLDPEPAPAIPEGTGPARVGRYAGLSIEALDPAAVVAFWEAAGWEVANGDAAQGWVLLTRDGCMGISVMGMHACPHLFPNPGLTYFNGGDNPRLIAGLREAGVPIHEEVTVFDDSGEVNNVILVDPGGLGFFMFND